MSRKIDKKVVVITGASKGIGRATAEYLSNKGCIVYGLSRSKPEGILFSHYTCDVLDYEKFKSILSEIHTKEGHIDFLINNAGMGISGAIEYSKPSDVNRLFDINVNALINLTAIALPYLRESRGRIVNIGSVAGPFPIPFQACYSASKSAIETFSLALDNEVRECGVRVTCVRPGDTKTSFTDNRVKTQIEDDGVYGKRIAKSVAKMEKDEQNGVPPEKVSKVIYKVLKRKNPPLVVTVDFVYKFLLVVAKVLPNSMKNKIIKLLYG